MTGITKQEQTKRHEKVDNAIIDSILPTAANVQEIAQQTGEHPSLVHRRFLRLGLKWSGRWVYKHNEAKHE